MFDQLATKQLSAAAMLKRFAVGRPQADYAKHKVASLAKQEVKSLRKQPASRRP